MVAKKSSVKRIKNKVVEEKKEEKVKKELQTQEKKEVEDENLEYFKDVADSEEESDDLNESDSSDDEEKEEKDEFQKGDKVIALNPEDEEKIKNKINEINKEKKNENKIKVGVIYLSHIPHGFYEKQMKAYFTQFGEVTKLRLSRNKKTGKSKHYAFIEFKNEEVAKIVAETMNNYILYDHVLKCSVIPEDKVHPDTFVGANKKYKVVPAAKIERKKKQQLKSGDEYKKLINKLAKKDEMKRKRLVELGIDYDFDGYDTMVKKSTKKTKKN